MQSGAPLLSLKARPVLCSVVEFSSADQNGSTGFLANLSNNGATPNRRSWKWTYNAAGQMLTATDPLLHVTTYTYYPDTTSDHMLGDLHTILDALGHTTSLDHYNAQGQVLQNTDANGIVTTYSYDLRQRLKTRTSAFGTSHSRTTTYTYLLTGLLQRVDLPAGVVATSAGAAGAQQGRSITYVYDDAQRLTKITSASGEELDYGLDNAGNVIREELLNSTAVQRQRRPCAARLRWPLAASGTRSRSSTGPTRPPPTAMTPMATHTTQWPLVVAYGESTSPQELRRYNALNQLTSIEDAANGNAGPLPSCPMPATSSPASRRPTTPTPASRLTALDRA